MERAIQTNVPLTRHVAVGISWTRMGRRLVE